MKPTHGQRLAHLLCALAALIHGAFAMAQGQSISIDVARRDIDVTYAFDPTPMSFAEQANLAPSLSALWDRYGKSPQIYRAALRIALAEKGLPEMAYCDGGMLLLAKSREPPDRTLGLRSIAECSLAEIQQTPYFYTMHELAVGGVDTLPLQFKMLARPRYSVFIVQHALSLGQNYAFVYPLLVQDEANYVPRLIERAKIETDETAQKTLALALLYAATPPAERALRAMADPTSAYAAGLKKEAARMVERIESARGLPAMVLWVKAGMPTGTTEAELRAKRRARMRSISDEALMDLDLYTPLLYRLIK